MSYIFLYGPSGTGKTSVGKALAQNLDLPFVDLDQMVEMKAGVSISKIMTEQGEAGFRELESSALKEIVNGTEAVISLGGGALLRDANRTCAESAGNVILLWGGLDTLVERLKLDSVKRPLVADDLADKLEQMLSTRNSYYESFPNKVQVDAKTIGQVVDEIQATLGRHHVSAMGDYDVMMGPIERLKAGGLQNAMVVTDENVSKFHLARLASLLSPSVESFRSVVLPAGEAQKNLETVSLLWHSFLENKLDRNSTVIAMGGGVVGDLTGFAASTYMRGIDWVALPTTLLSMVDASLGGKTGFDLPQGKNLIGSFHPPKLVLADPAFLSTLPDSEFISGMAEVVKHGVISDPVLFELCSCGLDRVRQNLDSIVKRAMAVKIRIIEEDPYEKGLRAVLNLGHTVGHALETASGFELSHGQSIAIGMVAEAKYSARLGLADKNLVDQLSATLSSLGLPTRIPDGISRQQIVRGMQVDKKRKAKSIHFALPVKIGRVDLVEVTDLQSVLDEQ